MPNDLNLGQHDLDNQKLDSCPFCGGYAAFDCDNKRQYPHHVVCTGCGAKSEGSAFKNNEYNAKKWNKRA